jgi:hypothetical protein
MRVAMSGYMTVTLAEGVSMFLQEDFEKQGAISEQGHDSMLSPL